MSASKLVMLLVYGGTLFLSAILVFLIQLIIGKMITPLMGGTPEVWNTCMVFFQAMLLAGYAWAHWSTTRFGPRQQAMIQLFLLLVPLIFFPIAINKGLIPDGNDPNAFNPGPIAIVLVILFLSVGIPFFVVSASAPMLQKWFSSTDHPSAADPYFLYGASNLGSMGVLFAYPTLIEPSLTLSQQRWIWMGGYLLLAGLTALCAFLMWQSPPARPVPEPVDEDPTDENHPLSSKVTWGRRLRWITLALVPSSLLLGSTAYMTTDIAPIPLLWVLPLALYLGTFIIVFSKTPGRIQDWLVGYLEPVFPGKEKTLRNVIDGHKLLILILPLLILLLVFLMMAEGISKPSIFWMIVLHMVTLFVVAMVCHGELARDRPSTKHLTEFFMWMSFGGVVGGLINSLFAPLLFDGNYEYPLIMVVACMMLPALSKEEESGWGFTLDVALASMFILVGSLLIVLRLTDEDLPFQNLQIERYAWHIIAVAGLFVLGFWYISRARQDRAARVMDLVLPVTLAFLTVGLIWGMNSNFLVLNTLEARDAAGNVLVNPATGEAYGESRLDRVASWVNTAIDWLGTPFNAKWQMSGGQFGVIIAFGLPAILCYTFVERSLRFGLGVGAILLAGSFCATLSSSDLLQQRGFFGVLKVETAREPYRDPSTRRTVAYDQVHRLVHGTTLHGKQYYAHMARTPNGNFVEAPFPGSDLSQEALTYYHRTGPIGQVCQAYCPNPVGLGFAAGPFAGKYAYEDPQSQNKIGVIGLGTGTMSCYARPGQTIVFYDIDPLVKRISFDERKFDENGKLLPGQDPEYFTYVRDARARGANVELKLNDARLAIERDVEKMKVRARSPEFKKPGETDEQAFNRLRNQEGYKVLVVDAFSSDAIPIHLITQEAVELFLQTMRDDGIICYHISNRYLDLRPVLANIVQRVAEKNPAVANLTSVYQNDDQDERDYMRYFPGKARSTWVMIGRSAKDLERLVHEDEFEEARTQFVGGLGKPLDQWDEWYEMMKRWGRAQARWEKLTTAEKERLSGADLEKLSAADRKKLAGSKWEAYAAWWKKLTTEQKKRSVEEEWEDALADWEKQPADQRGPKPERADFVKAWESRWNRPGLEELLKEWDKLTPEQQKLVGPRPGLGLLGGIALLPMPTLVPGAPAIAGVLSSLLLEEYKYRDGSTKPVLSGRWHVNPPVKEVGVWTDDYAPILKAFNW